MCKNCYEKFVERSGKIMLICRLMEESKVENTDMTKLCICQRFCSDKDKYIPYQQKEGCKNYND